MVQGGTFYLSQTIQRRYVNIYRVFKNNLKSQEILHKVFRRKQKDA